MDPVDLSVIRGERQERCSYCGKPAHPEPLMCPRIESVTHFADGSAIEVHFWGLYEEEDGPDAA